MGLGSNLHRRGDGLVFRRRVPRAARTLMRTAFLRLPLGTHLLREGRRMAAHATRFTDAAFALVVACGGEMLDPVDVERVVLDLMRFELEAREAARAVAPARADAEIEAALRIEAATRATLVAALARRDYAALAAPINAALARLGVEVAEDAPDWRILARRAAIGLVAVCEENARREQGIYDEDTRLLATALRHETPHPGALQPDPFDCLAPRLPSGAGSGHMASAGIGGALAPSATAATEAGVPLAPMPLGPAARVAAVMAARPTPRPAPRTATAVPATTLPRRGPETRPVAPPLAPDGARRFHALGMAYVARRSAEEPKWALCSAPQVVAALKVFRETEGDISCDETTEARLHGFIEVYRRLPKTHHKGDGTTREIIARADAAEAAAVEQVEAMADAGACQGDIDTALAQARVPRVKAATVYRVQQDLQRIVRDEGLPSGAFARNVMEKVIWSKGKLKAMQKDEAMTPRLAWGDKARDLFASPVFTETLEDQGEPLFWLPLIAYAAGTRMEEAAQLKAEDVATVRGVCVFLIRQGEGQHLKNESSCRAIPIHSSLIALGLLELVARRRAEGQEWLFPNLARGTSRGRKSEVFSGNFTQYRRDNGLYDPQRDFHSLRKDFNITMKRTGVGLEIRKRLLGHRLEDVTEVHYDPEGSPVEAFRDAVERVRLDISGIRRPFGADGGEIAARPTLRLVR